MRNKSNLKLVVNKVKYKLQRIFDFFPKEKKLSSRYLRNGEKICTKSAQKLKKKKTIQCVSQSKVSSSTWNTAVLVCFTSVTGECMTLVGNYYYSHISKDVHSKELSWKKARPQTDGFRASGH